ncbi:unnamed protein product [Amoebophrya sp. A25]|nr:unnamed protein product [Amoebophrya sp. A25]|eukprot:GSA25T00011540001.1
MEFFNNDENDAGFGSDEEDIFGLGDTGAEQLEEGELEQMIFEEKYEPSREATILLIDADLEHNPELYEEVFLSIESFVRHKIIAACDDKLSIVKYNTKNAKNYSSFPGIYTVLEHFVDPGTHLVRAVRNERTAKRAREQPGTSGTGAVMAEVFWNAAQMFRLQLGRSSLTYKKRVMIFSSNDDPLHFRGVEASLKGGTRGGTPTPNKKNFAASPMGHVLSPLKLSEQQQTDLDICLTRVNDCREQGIELEFYPVLSNSGGSVMRRPFDMDLFWLRVIFSENIEDEKDNSMPVGTTGGNGATNVSFMSNAGGSKMNTTLIADESMLEESQNFKSLESRIRKRLFKKRALARCPLYLQRDPDIALSVGIFINILPTKPEAKIRLHEIDNEIVLAKNELVERPNPNYIPLPPAPMNGEDEQDENNNNDQSGAAEDGTAAAAVGGAKGKKVNDAMGYYDRTDCSSFLQFAGEQIPFTDSEMNTLRNKGKEPCLELIGFISRDKLKPYHHKRHSYAVYPQESRIIGSAMLYKTLLQEMRTKNLIMLVWFRERQNAEPRFSALLPNKFDPLFLAGSTSSSANGGAGEPLGSQGDHTHTSYMNQANIGGGMVAGSSSSSAATSAAATNTPLFPTSVDEDNEILTLILLPHLEDYRNEQSVKVVDTIRHPMLDAAPTCEGMALLLNQVEVVGFHPTNVANHALQKHYAAIQCLALGEQAPEAIEDETEPDQGYFNTTDFTDLVQTIQDSKPPIEVLNGGALMGGGVLPLDAPAGGGGGRKRKAPTATGTGGVDNAAPLMDGDEGGAKRPKTAASPKDALTEDDIVKLMQQGRLANEKVPDLKAFLKSRRLNVSGKKAELVARIEEYMEQIKPEL